MDASGATQASVSYPKMLFSKQPGGVRNRCTGLPVDLPPDPQSSLTDAPNYDPHQKSS